MADFFTRLAERTLGLANTIQPVLTPFFAPGTPLLDAASEVEQTIEERERSPQPRSRSQDAPRSEAEPHAEQRTSPIASRQDRRIAPRSETIRPNEQHSPPEDLAATRATDSDHEPDSRLPIIEQHSENPQLAQPGAAPQRVYTPRRSDPTAQMQRLVQDSAAPIVVRSSLQSQPAEPAEDSAPRTLVPIERAGPAQPDRLSLLPPADQRSAVEKRAIQPEQRSLAPGSARAEPVMREQSLPRVQQVNRSPEPPEPPAPQIHVSIGRVEVRAVTPQPQPAPQPAAPPTPRMSLDDYLRSQNGGRR